MKESRFDKTPSTQMSCNANNVSPIRADLLSEEDKISELSNESSCHELLIAIEDLQSVISYNASDDRTYNLKENLKKKEIRNLDLAFTSLDEKRQQENWGSKRFKISENTEIQYPLFDSNDLNDYCEKVNSYCLTLDNQNRVRYVSKADPDSSKTNFFNFLKEELESVAKHYRKSIDEVHTKFMEVSCDFGVLKYILEQEKAHNDIKTSSKYAWNGLEDLAVQESKNSIQFKGLAMEKTKYEIKKRQEFLKTLKDLKFEKDN